MSKPLSREVCVLVASFRVVARMETGGTNSVLAKYVANATGERVAAFGCVDGIQLANK